PATGIHDLCTLPGGTYSSANAINSSSHVVGSAASSDGSQRAFRWDPSPGMRALGALGPFGAAASGINDSGQVVGYSFSSIDDNNPAFIWDAAHGMQD